MQHNSLIDLAERFHNLIQKGINSRHFYRRQASPKKGHGHTSRIFSGMLPAAHNRKNVASMLL